MTEEESSKQLIEQEPKPKSDGGKGLLFVMLLVVLLVVAGGGYYLNRQITQLGAGSDRNASDLQARLASASEQVRIAQQNNAALEAKLQQMQTDVQLVSNNFSELYQRNNADMGWLLAEVKYLLLIASHRLVLEKDVGTALVALQTADKRLRDMVDPGLIAVREQVIADISALQGADQTDIAGMSLFLSNLIRRAENLPLNKKITGITPLKQEQETEVESESGWGRLVDSVWQELKSLVVVSKSRSDAVATLLPEERYFLYQNLRLQLESARFALLAKDGENFHESVRLVTEWLQQYFDTNDNDVSVALDVLGQMLVVDFDQDLPSVAGSIAALEQYIQQDTADSLPEESDSSE